MAAAEASTPDDPQPAADDHAAAVAGAPARLDAVRRLHLLDGPVDASLDLLTRLVRRLLDAPIALVSLVDADRQFFAGAQGLEEPARSARQTPLTHSFCKHVVASGEPLEISDARSDPLVADNGALTALGVVAYLGMPLRGPTGHVVGSLCVIDTEPRGWSDDDRETLRELSQLVMTELEVRSTNAELDERVKQRTRELEENRDRLRSLTIQLTHAEHRERLRLATVLHDELQQLLVAAKFRAHDLPALDTTDDRRAASDEIADILDESIRVSRNLTAELYPPGVHQRQLTEALAWLADRFHGRHGMRVELVGDDVEMDEAPATVVFAAVRELLFNVVKHAGTKAARIEVEWDGAMVVTRVIDEGAGFDTADDAFEQNVGLFSLRERLLGLGGTLTIRSARGRGTRAEVWVPC